MHISDPHFQTGALTLAEEEVQVWSADLPALSPAEDRWRKVLSADELTRAARFHFDRDRQHYTATRALLRIILGSFLGDDPASLAFRYSDKGKPSLAAAGNGVEFNVSHSGTIALLAFARGRLLGVDVEKIREDFDASALAERFFSENEQQQLSAIAQEEKFNGFFRCWTRKEAYIKAIGTGLSLPLDQFDVSLRPGEEDALLATRPEESEAGRWLLQEIAAPAGYVAALCVRGRGWHLKA